MRTGVPHPAKTRNAHRPPNTENRAEGISIVKQTRQKYKEDFRMKFRTTQKAIRENYNTIICVPYCGLQNLLNHESPVAYTVRREGWAADIYDMGGGVAIVTGYAPFGKIRPSYELRERYETQAEKIRYNRSIAWAEQKEQLQGLARAFIDEAVKAAAK